MKYRVVKIKDLYYLQRWQDNCWKYIQAEFSFFGQSCTDYTTWYMGDTRWGMTMKQINKVLAALRKEAAIKKGDPNFELYDKDDLPEGSLILEEEI